MEGVRCLRRRQQKGRGVAIMRERGGEDRIEGGGGGGIEIADIQKG